MLPLLKRKSSGEVGEEEALPRRVRSKSPPASPSKQMAVGLSQPEVEGQVPPNLSVAPPEVTGDGTVSDAELGVKLFPNQPPEVAAAMWVEFVTNAKLCIDHYNKKNQVNFVYKHSRGNGLIFVGEQDGSEYYHLNFHAQDKSGHSQLFFSEIEARGNPKEENVTCCSPVSPSDAGGRSIRTIEEALKHVYPDWETVDMDYDHYYALFQDSNTQRGRATSPGTLLIPDNTMGSEVLGNTSLQVESANTWSLRSSYMLQHLK